MISSIFTSPWATIIAPIIIFIAGRIIEIKFINPYVKKREDEKTDRETGALFRQLEQHEELKARAKKITDKV